MCAAVVYRMRARNYLVNSQLKYVEVGEGGHICDDLLCCRLPLLAIAAVMRRVTTPPTPLTDKFCSFVRMVSLCSSRECVCVCVCRVCMAAVRNVALCCMPFVCILCLSLNFGRRYMQNAPLCYYQYSFTICTCCGVVMMLSVGVGEEVLVAGVAVFEPSSIHSLLLYRIIVSGIWW